MLLFAIAFGLATDYAVFLLSRIKEARDGGLPDREAVAFGVERTGRIVTAAALLFIVAVGAFATSGVLFIKQVGIGTAIAVAIDATIVRALLVPALMALLGRWNWWAPAPLRRLHDAHRDQRGAAAPRARRADGPPGSAFDRATAVSRAGDGAWAATLRHGLVGPARAQRRLPGRDRPARDRRAGRRPGARAALADAALPAPAGGGRADGGRAPSSAPGGR